MSEYEQQPLEDFEPESMAGRLLIHLYNLRDSEHRKELKEFVDTLNAQYDAIPAGERKDIAATFPSGLDAKARGNYWGNYLMSSMVEFADDVEKDIETFEQESIRVESEIQTMDMDLATIMTPTELGNL